MAITKNVFFIAKDNYINELKSLLETMVKASRAEEGCLLYNIYQTNNDLKTFVVIETWESESALNGHKNSEHYKHYKANFEPFTANKWSNELTPID